MIINWTACAELMPPIGAKTIFRNKNRNEFLYTSNVIDKEYSLRDFTPTYNYEWTEYTKEKWDYLNER